MTGSVYNIPLQIYCKKYFCKYNKEQQQNLIELTMASEMWHDIQMLLFRRFYFEGGTRMDLFEAKGAVSVTEPRLYKGTFPYDDFPKNAFIVTS